MTNREIAADDVKYIVDHGLSLVGYALDRAERVLDLEEVLREVNEMLDCEIYEADDLHDLISRALNPSAKEK